MKRICSALAAAVLLVLLVIPASADNGPDRCVYDTAGLLTEQAQQIFEDIAQDISRQRQCAVYFMTVEDYRDYGDGEIFDVARQIFLDGDLGMGENRDGVLLLLSMKERDYCLLAHGFGDTALTDYGKDYISDQFLDDFGDDEWYYGCMDYLTYTDELLTKARDGNIYDRGSWITGAVLWRWSFVAGLVIAAITCLIQRTLMKKKVRLQKGAMNYLEGPGVNITRRSDRYTHSTEVRHKIETNKSSGSSGGHSHSGGFSGKSGKF